MRIEAGGPSWPTDLDHIDGPPRTLWLRGRTELLREGRRVAIVGTRSPTPYGEAQADRFGRALAAAGLIVVSGMARGVDQAAHRAALAAGGDTIAVLGSGVDVPWPDVPLADELAVRGLLVSEFPPGQGPRPHHFPLRNRIISGISEAVVVIEAAGASGSLITARWAADQGRAVYALPGRVDHPMSRGAHRLLREGAGLLESPEELIGELLGDATCERHAPPPPEGPLLEALVGETLSVDELAQRLGADVSAVLVELVSHELSGRVVRAPGGLYRLPSR
ncbi:MAG: DNA-protecting protein DprA [Planctomycetes bacterium]|nr:DNA-processing protein DprA [Planctomycetota bacterium]MCB9904636.1 DNA-protecting protein DprA [Planctomycetota bacterium]